MITPEPKYLKSIDRQQKQVIELKFFWADIEAVEEFKDLGTALQSAREQMKTGQFDKIQLIVGGITIVELNKK